VSTQENVLGKSRFLTLGGKVIVETLTGYSSTVPLLRSRSLPAQERLPSSFWAMQDHFYTYHIAEKPDGLFPGDFINYHARMSFKTVTDKNATFAEWSVPPSPDSPHT
jgi:hypothetical protein